MDAQAEVEILVRPEDAHEEVLRRAFTLAPGATDEETVDLPPGRYVANVTLQGNVQEHPFLVQPGPPPRIVVVLGAEGVRFE